MKLQACFLVCLYVCFSLVRGNLLLLFYETVRKNTILNIDLYAGSTLENGEKLTCEKLNWPDV